MTWLYFIMCCAFMFTFLCYLSPLYHYQAPQSILTSLWLPKISLGCVKIDLEIIMNYETHLISLCDSLLFQSLFITSVTVQYPQFIWCVLKTCESSCGRWNVISAISVIIFHYNCYLPLNLYHYLRCVIQVS